MIDAATLGATRSQIHRWAERGLIDRLGNNSITFPGQPRTFRMRLRAALTDAGPDAVVSHGAAARLLGLEGFDDADVEVTTLRAGRNRTIATGRLHTTRELRLIDRTEAAGLQCTSAARTIIDLAPRCSRRELENLILLGRKQWADLS